MNEKEAVTPVLSLCNSPFPLLQQLVQFIINGFDVRADNDLTSVFSRTADACCACRFYGLLIDLIVVLTQSQSSAPKATNCLKRQFPAHTLLWNCPAHKCAPWQAWKKDSRLHLLSSSVRFSMGQI